MALGRHAAAKVLAGAASIVTLATAWALVRGNPPPASTDAAVPTATAATQRQAAPAPARANQSVPVTAPRPRARTHVS